MKATLPEASRVSSFSSLVSTTLERTPSPKHCKSLLTSKAVAVYLSSSVTVFALSSTLVSAPHLLLEDPSNSCHDTSLLHHTRTTLQRPRTSRLCCLRARSRGCSRHRRPPRTQACLSRRYQEHSPPLCRCWWQLLHYPRRNSSRALRGD